MILTKKEIFIKILHLFHTLKIGGAQMMRLRLIKIMMHFYSDIEHEIIALEDGELRFKAQQLTKVHILESKYSRFFLIPGLIKLTKQINPTIIHSLPWLPNFFARVFLKIFYKKALILNDLHGQAYLSNFHRIVDRFTWKLADKWCFVTDQLNKHFAKDWFVEEKDKCRLQILPNFVDQDEFVFDSNLRFEYRNFLQINQNDFVLLFVGRFDRIKRVDWLLRCFYQAHLHLKNLKLILCGSGPEEKNLKHLVMQFCIDRNVFFIESSQLQKIYCAADLLILCSESEGMPTVFLEAYCSSLPILLSENLRSVDFTGFLNLYYFKNEHDFEEKISQMQKKKNLRKKKLPLNFCSTATIADKYLSIVKLLTLVS